MFDKSSVFSSSFEKILAQLDIDYKTITEDRDSIRIILSSFPDKIKKIVIELVKFTNDNSADLILFGSRAAGKTGVRHDWDFAVNFHKTVQDKKLRLLKQKLQDQSFPYRVDLVNLNIAPTWFKDSIDEDKIYLRKEDKDEKK